MSLSGLLGFAYTSTFVSKFFVGRGVKKTPPWQHKFHQQKCWCGQHYVGRRGSPADIANTARWGWFNYAGKRALSRRQRAATRETLQCVA